MIKKVFTILSMLSTLHVYASGETEDGSARKNPLHCNHFAKLEGSLEHTADTMPEGKTWEPCFFFRSERGESLEEFNFFWEMTLSNKEEEVKKSFSYGFDEDYLADLKTGAWTILAYHLDGVGSRHEPDENGLKFFEYRGPRYEGYQVTQINLAIRSADANEIYLHMLYNFDPNEEFSNKGHHKCTCHRTLAPYVYFIVDKEVEGWKVEPFLHIPYTKKDLPGKEETPSKDVVAPGLHSITHLKKEMYEGKEPGTSRKNKRRGGVQTVKGGGAGGGPAVMLEEVLPVSVVPDPSLASSASNALMRLPSKDLSELLKAFKMSGSPHKKS